MGETRDLVDHDEPRLVVRATDGDRAARGELYRRHADAVARLLASLVGDPRVAEDLVQDVFVTAFAAMPSFDLQRSVGAWLHGIAINHARNHRRRNSRRRRLWERFAGPRVDAREDGDDAATALVQRDLLTRLYRALDELDDGAREAFVLRVIERRSLEDAAAVLGVPVRIVSRRAIKAEQHVRARLEAGR